jgi:hypothetical protein
MRPKDKAPRGGGALQKQLNLGTDQQRKPATGRRPFQGNSNARQADQRPPTWESPPGWHAAKLLDALWGPRRRRGPR